MNRGGQTILEVVIALAIFIFISGSLAAMILGGTHAAQQGSQLIEADVLAQEGLEALYSIRNGAWNELSPSPSGIRISGGQWILSGTSDIIYPFTRTITLAAVCRSLAGDITICPASYTDPHTRYATSLVTWTSIEGVQNQTSRSAYLTFWDSLRWTQTDWILGPGQPIWSLSNRYDSDDGHINRLLEGQVQLSPVVGGGTWSLYTQLPEGDDLHDVWDISASDIWAVGDDGLIVHYDGTAWTTVPSPHGDRINALYMHSPSSGWAVGDGGKIIRYNGTSWSQVASPVTDHLHGIWMVSETDGWAVGDAGKVIRYNGTSWSQFTDTGGNVWYDVHMMSASDGWIVGNQGFIYRWNGSAWSLHTDSGGTVWRSVYLHTATEGFTVGDQGLIYRWDGTSWSLSVDTGGTNWRSVHLASSTDGWATGAGGDIYHWNGASWSPSTSPTTSDINEVHMLSSILSWAVGDGGRIFRYQAGTVETSGTLLSSSYFMSNPSPVSVIEWDESLPVLCPACDIRFQVQSAPDNGGVPGTFGPWYGALGIDTFFSDPVGSTIPTGANGNSWVRYRVFLDGDGLNTPTLQEVRMYYQ